ncbi:TELO2-interacting protein 2-like [Ylistrum balloti]|uniref:TELO2-interacting protein 2-like n=1 Tax=Ylistrum balloti TaxID=509963 RepID=UPI002905E8CE|nr:TELO2-interacting protein 2-like [Ylistrum balloti]
MEGLKALFDGFLKNHHQSESRHDFSIVWQRFTLVDILRFLRQIKKKEDFSVRVEIVTVILTECADDWLVGSLQQEQEAIALYKGIQEVVSSVLVPTFQDKEHYAFDENDFPSVASQAENILSFVIVLLSRLGDLRKKNSHVCEIAKLIYKVCPHAMILALEHVENGFWTTTTSIKKAKRLLQCLCELLDTDEYSKLLQCHLMLNDEIQRTESTLLYKIFQIIKSKLLRETWKKSPGAKCVFIWCLNHTSFPVLSEFLESVLPPALLFTDDYMLVNKVSGVSCLMHIVNNVSAEELRWYGRADVILEALRHQLYTSEPTLLAKTIPAILCTLKIVEKNPQSGETTRPVSRFEEIYQQLLQNAEGENILKLRRIYTQHLHIFVEMMGISAVRYLGITLNVIGHFLEISDSPSEEARFNMLLLLQKTIRYCWPRIPCHMNSILKMLVKCLCDLSLDSLTISGEVKTRLVTAIKEILVIMKCLNSENVKGQLGSLDCDGIPDLCREICKQVVETDVTTFTL